MKNVGNRDTHLYISFIDLTKDFDLVSRVGLFKILPKLDCPAKILGIIKSFIMINL